MDGTVCKPGDVVTFLDVHETCGKCWYCTVAKASTRCPHRRVYGITYSAEEGLAGRLGRGHLPQAGRQDPASAGQRAARALYRRRLWPAHRGSRHRTRRDPAGRQRRGPGQRPGWPEPVILAQLQGAGQVIVVGAPGAAAGDGPRAGRRCDDRHQLITIRRPVCSAVRDLTYGRGRRRYHRGHRQSGGGARGHADDPRCRAHGRGRPVHRCRRQPTINPHLDINRKHLEIRGCWGSDFSHLYRGMRVLARYGDRFGWERMISRVYTLDEADQALADVQDMKVVKALIRP